MKSSIPLGWLLATVLFALIGNAWLTVVFFVGTALFSFMSLSVDYRSIEGFVVSDVLKGMADIAEEENK